MLLDIIIKSRYFNNTVYCIDEPETHIHTSLQSRLLNEMYNLVPNNSQLWISTHSIGMLEKAREIELNYPGTVCFLDFSDIDFDVPVVLKPSIINATIWNKFLELTFGDFAKIIAPKRVVFCEGTIQGKTYKNFDTQIYERIFSSKYYDTSFVSIGSCSELENDDNVSIKIIKEVLNNSSIIRIVDRDDKSDTEVSELVSKGVKVLKRRHIECYLFDDSIISELCVQCGKEDKQEECLAAKRQAIESSIKRGNPEDDIKSASGDIYVKIKQILELRQCGNTKASFLRDTMAPLITEGTQVYRELESEIFSR